MVTRRGRWRHKAEVTSLPRPSSPVSAPWDLPQHLNRRAVHVVYQHTKLLPLDMMLHCLKCEDHQSPKWINIHFSCCVRHTHTQRVYLRLPRLNTHCTSLVFRCSCVGVCLSLINLLWSTEVLMFVHLTQGKWEKRICFRYSETQRGKRVCFFERE